MRGLRGNWPQVTAAVLLASLYFWHGGKSALFLAAVSMLILSYGILLQIFGPRHIHIRRHIRKDQIAAGERIRVHVQLEIRCVLPLLWLVVCDNTPAGVHRKLLFPGMKRQWSYQYEITGLARGVHAWEQGRAYCGDVFGWNKVYTVLEGEQPIVVVPASPGHAGSSIWPEACANSGEGMGMHRHVQGAPGTEIREYQPGDSLNQIHWKSTARTGKLHTLIPEMPQRTSLAVVVYEEHSGYEKHGAEDQTHEAFERAVIGAADWVREAADAQMPCQLWLSGEELAGKADMPLGAASRHEVQINRSGAAGEVQGTDIDSEERLAYALKRLAYARLRKEIVPDEVQLDVSRLEQLPYGSSILVFTGQLDERLVVWLEYAAALGFQAVVHLANAPASIDGYTENSGYSSADSHVGPFEEKQHRLEGKQNKRQDKTLDQVRKAAGGNAAAGAPGASIPSVNTKRTEEWTGRLISKGVRIVCQEAAANGGSFGGKAGIVDVGA